MATGTAVVLMEATVDELIASVGKTLEELKAKINGPVAGLHLVHCGGRRAGIDARIEEVYEQVKKTIGVYHLLWNLLLANTDMKMTETIHVEA